VSDGEDDERRRAAGGGQQQQQQQQRPAARKKWLPVSRVSPAGVCVAVSRLTEDHKPDSEGELERIHSLLKAGATVKRGSQDGICQTRPDTVGGGWLCLYGARMKGGSQDGMHQTRPDTVGGVCGCVWDKRRRRPDTVSG
jgi:hypothetical protein